MRKVALGGSLALPDHPVGAVLFAVRGLSERRDPVRLQLADFLHHAGLATLVASVTDPEEPELDDEIERLAGRVAHGLTWMAGHPRLQGLPVGCLADGPAVAPALVAGAHSERLAALVVRGGRPDHASAALSRVHAPTLLVVGEHEHEALEASRTAMPHLAGPSELAVIEGTQDAVSEPRALGTVCMLARRWFLQYLAVSH